MIKTPIATKVKNVIAWIDWLQSGKLEQVQGQLMSQTIRENERGKETVCQRSYCCLGVASHKVLGARIEKGEETDESPNLVFGRGDSAVREFGALPEGYYERLGIMSPTGVLSLVRNRNGEHRIFEREAPTSYEHLYISLADLNDGFENQMRVPENGFDGRGNRRKAKLVNKTVQTPPVTFAKIAELLLLDLRTGQLGIFETSVAAAWRAHYNFTE